jgi:bifunctional non-homologous end joining protein LigD
VITHPDKVLFPDDGITKGELARYYENIAPHMLPHIRDRPVTMERYPAGIGAKGFIQKDVSKGFPEWLERVEVPKKTGSSHYALANDVRALLWMANQNSITPHVWTSRVPHLHYPDLCVFDLDPSADDPTALRRAALQVRALLEELGLESWLKTSGSKGFHIVVPLDGEAAFDTVYEFTGAVGAILVQRDPENLTQEFIKADRQGRLLIDTGRNGFGATFAAVYAVRPQAGAPVSAPCTWEELAAGSVEPRTFRLASMAERIEKVGDLWAAMRGREQSLREPMAKVRALLTDEDWLEARAAKRRRPKARKSDGKKKR